MEVWRVLVVVLTAVVALVVKAEEAQQGTLWTDSEVFKIELEEWFSGSPEWMLKNLPHELLGIDRNITTPDWSDVLGVYLPSIDPDVVDNEQCRLDVETFLTVINDKNLTLLVSAVGGFWPIKMPDSWGKVPDGILYGNIRPWGVMEYCNNIDADYALNLTERNTTIESHFRGRYCLVTSRGPDDKTRFQDVLIPSHQVPRTGFTVGVLPYVSYGTCMPSTCTAGDLKASIEALQGQELDMDIDCYIKDEDTPLYSGDIVFIVFLGIMGSLLFIASVVDLTIDYYDKQQFREGPLKFLLVFSAYNNLKKIFHHNTKEDPELISCLHGIRVLSMCWILWGHTYLMASFFAVNIVYMKQLTDDLIEQTILAGVFAVDTFFLLSGLLVTYGLLKQFSKTNRINWIMYYVHRLLRLTPPILVTAAFTATLSRFTLVGPMSKQVERTFIQTCRDNWWMDVLYATNFIDLPCLSQCWYTAADTQLYVVAPLVLVPLLYRPKLGIPWMGVVTAISAMIPMIITGVYSLPTAAIVFRTNVPDTDIDTYMTPWCRATAYLVGMWGGVLLHHFRNRKLKLEVWQALLGWVLAATVGLLVVYGMAEYNTLDNPKPIPQGVSIAFDGLSRGAWALAVLWVIFACHKGYGGPINDFLAHPCWQPLSRLTYCIYLISIPVQIMYLGTQYTLAYMNHLNEYLLAAGYLFISGIFAVLVSLISEGPVLGLEKLLLRRPAAKET